MSNIKVKSDSSESDWDEEAASFARTIEFTKNTSKFYNLNYGDETDAFQSSVLKNEDESDRLENKTIESNPTVKLPITTESLKKITKAELCKVIVQLNKDLNNIKSENSTIRENMIGTKKLDEFIEGFSKSMEDAQLRCFNRLYKDFFDNKKILARESPIEISNNFERKNVQPLNEPLCKDSGVPESKIMNTEVENLKNFVPQNSTYGVTPQGPQTRNVRNMSWNNSDSDNRFHHSVPLPQEPKTPPITPFLHYRVLDPPKQLKLDPNTPKFHGNPNEDVDDWLYKIRINLDVANIPEERFLDLIINFVLGKAGVFVRRLRESFAERRQRLFWQDFKDAMTKRYRPIDHARKIRNQLIHLKQTSSFNEYVDHFQNLCNQLEPTDLSEAEKLHYFTEGLHAGARFQIISKKIQSVDEAILIAAEFESCNTNRHVVDKINVIKVANKQNNRYKAGVQATTSHQRDKSIHSFNKKDNKHVQYNANTTNNNPVKCFKCKKLGHLANNCRQKMVSVATIEKEKHEKILTASDNGLEMLKIKGKIENFDVDFYFDSGATTSIVSLRVVKKYKLDILPSNVRIKSANNAVDNVIGTTKPLMINVEGHYCILPLLIMNLDHYDVLLGLNWFKTSRAGIFPAQKMLKFDSDTIQLSTNDDENSDFEVNLVDGIDESDLVPINFDILSENKEKPVACEQLTTEQQMQFDKLQFEISDIFAFSLEDLGCCKTMPHTINTTSETPIYIPRYRKSEYENQLIKAEVQKMLNANIIEHSTSPWSASVVLVPKPNGDKRLCVDYRKLNAITVPDPYPIPRVQDILDSLSGSKWFTTFDLKSGYWQTIIDKKSIEKTAFTTADGHFQFLRTPFGLKNAPAQFSRLMQMTLGHLPFISIYLDDLTIHSSTFEEHLNHIATVIKVLRKANLKINKDKCKWFASEIKLLGHIVSGGCVKMDPEKIKAIVERKPPTTVKQVQEFMGCPNYYRRYIKDFSKMTRPIFNLLKKDVPFVWDQECANAFEWLKEKLTEYPILRQPVFTKKFVLHCDASGYAIGVILTQIDDIMDVLNMDYAVAYGSRLLRGAEINYGCTQKECLAIVWGIKYFHTYVYGTRFVVVTDNIALSWLNNPTIRNSRLARWSMYLQEYTFDVVYRKGSSHGNVDTISRPVLTIQESFDDDDIIKILDPYEDETLLYFLRYKKHMSGVSKRQIKRVTKLLQHYKLIGENLFYRKKVEDDKYLKVPLIVEREELMDQAHLLGHFNVLTTVKRLQEEYFWPKMSTDVSQNIKKCLPCQRMNHGRTYHHPAQALPIVGLFDRVGIDLVLGLPSDNPENFNGIVVITEYLSKYPHAMPIRSKEATEIVEHLFFFISQFGAPDTLLSDQGTEFLNACVAELLKKTGTEHRVTSAYHPNTNGLTERFNQTMVTVLRKHCESNPQDWYKWLPYVLMSYRTRIHSTTGMSPFSLMFGRQMKGFKDWTSEPQIDVVTSILNRSLEIKKHFEITIPKTIDTINKKQIKQKETQDKQFTTRLEPLTSGTVVYVKVDGLLSKLEPRYKGPFTVVERTNNGNYILRDQIGQIMNKSYPLEKLKLSSDQNDTQIYAIEKIIDDRIKNNIQEYFVKWKNYPDSENSWERENNFVSMRPIHQYWKNKNQHGGTNIENRVRNKKLIHENEPKEIIETRKSKRLQRVNLAIATNHSNVSIPPLFKILTFLLLVQSNLSIHVSDSFKYCEGLINARQADLDHTCLNKLHNHPTLKELKDFQYKDFSILKKISHAVSGTAYQCRMEKVQVTTYTSFMYDQTSNTKIESFPTTKDDCWYMVHTKKCKDKIMQCEGLDCVYRTRINETYKWLSHVEHIGYNCFIQPRILSAKHLNDNVFDTTNPPCKPMDFYCQIFDSIIVWTNDAIHSCPFEVIANARFEIKGTFIASSNDSLAFQLVNVEHHCGHNIFVTNAGLFLIDSLQEKMFRRSKLSLQDVQDLSLAQGDYLVLFQTNIMDKLHKYICHTFINNLKAFSINNEYVNFRDLHGNSLILYADNGHIYIPHCLNIKEIDIITDTKNCYKDVPIKFRFNNKTFFAFLQHDNIIKRHSKLVQCQHVKKLLSIGNSNLVITRTGSKNLVEKSKTIHVEPLNIINTPLYDLNFHHMHELIEGVDVIDEIQRFLHVPESQGDFTVIADNVVNTENVLVKPINKVKENYEYFKAEVKNLAIGSLSYVKLIILILSALFFICLLVCLRKSIINFVIILHAIIRKKLISAGITKPPEELVLSSLQQPQKELYPFHELSSMRNKSNVDTQHNETTEEYNGIDNMSEQTKQLVSQLVQQLPLDAKTKNNPRTG